MNRFFYQIYARPSRILKPILGLSMFSCALYAASQTINKANALESVGHKFKRQHPQSGQDEYLYLKFPPTRQALIHELLVGTLGKVLFPNDFPPVYLYQDKNKYGVLSASIAQHCPYSDLETWASKYYNDHEARQYAPRQLLGVSLAFDLLLGKSSGNLANIVVLWTSEGRCYSINHQSAFSQEAKILKDATQGLQYLKLNQHKFAEVAQPYLTKAIENDINEKRILNFYQSFADLSDECLQAIVKSIDFLTPKETIECFNSLKQRQASAIIFIRETKSFKPK